MARKPKPGYKPSFFRILSHDLTRQLKLPTSFVRKHGYTFPERCKLRSSHGQTFDVRIEKTNDGKHCFFTGKGWRKFVKELELEIGEIVIMWFDGELEFDVSVFKTNGCEKEMLCGKPELVEFIGDENVSNKQGVDNEDEETETEVGGEGESWPQFEIVLKGWRKSKLVLPKEFAEKAGLIGERAVVLKYVPKKPHWPILLDKKLSHNLWFQFHLSTGWSKFCETNRLIFGKTYSFTFNPVENVIQVELVD